MTISIAKCQNSIDDAIDELILQTMFRRSKARALRQLNVGKLNLLTTVSDKEFSVGLIKPGEHMFYYKSGWPEPVPAGLWIGIAEDEWGISEQQWDKLSLIEKARLEAQEQLAQWVELEYYEEWLDTYAPEVSDQLLIQEVVNSAEEVAYITHFLYVVRNAERKRKKCKPAEVEALSLWRAESSKIVKALKGYERR